MFQAAFCSSWWPCPRWKWPEMVRGVLYAHNPIVMYTFWNIPIHKETILIRQCIVMPWLKLSQDSDTSKPHLKCCYAQHSSVETFSSHDKLLAQEHSPSKTEDKSAKTACACPSGRRIKSERIKISHAGSSLTLWHAFVNVQFHTLSDPLRVQLGNATTTTTLWCQQTNKTQGPPCSNWQQAGARKMLYSCEI